MAINLSDLAKNNSFLDYAKSRQDFEYEMMRRQEAAQRSYERLSNQLAGVMPSTKPEETKPNLNLLLLEDVR